MADATPPTPVVKLPVSKWSLLDRTTAPYWAVKQDYDSTHNWLGVTISVHELQTKGQAVAFLSASPSNRIIPRRWFHSFMPSFYWESSLGADSVKWREDE